MKKALLKFVCFKSGNSQLLIERRHVLAMTTLSSDLHPENLTIKSISELLAIQEQEQPQKQCLLKTKTKDRDLYLQVNDPVELIEIEPELIHPLPELFNTNLKIPSIKALAILAENIAIIIDPLQFDHDK